MADAREAFRANSPPEPESASRFGGQKTHAAGAWKKDAAKTPGFPVGESRWI